MPGHSAGIGLPYDPEGARQLLAAAGYRKGGGRGFPVVESLTVPGPVGHQIREYLQAQWRENLGLEIPWQTMEWATYLDRVRREPPHMIGIGWVCDYPDPDSYLRVALRLHTKWRNETYDELVEEARRVTDQEERMKLYQKADRILVEEAPIMLVAYGRGHLLVKPWMSKFPTSATSWWFWKDAIIEPH
jgi:ABC-type transport system substrate-binding protein